MLGPIDMGLGLRSRSWSSLAQSIETNVGGDAVQPSAQCLWFTKGFAATVSPQKRLLCQILGSCRVTYQTQNVAVNPMVVGIKDGRRIGRLNGLPLRHGSTSSDIVASASDEPPGDQLE